MLVIAAILLCLLPSQVNGLTTDAKCLPGYEWMFSTIGQSPCDVAAELASVCIARPFNLSPLDIGYVYSGPTLENQNSCRCSSVYYSLLSGCAYCQGRNHRRWSVYITNCSSVHLGVYTEQIPIGVKVPAYAYQDVSIADMFNTTLAYSVRGVESSRPPSSITQILTSAVTSSTSFLSASRDSGGSAPQIIINTPVNTPAIVGGVVGGLVGLGLIAALITFAVLRSKRKRSQNNLGFHEQRSPNMISTPNTTASLIHSSTSPPPGSPGSPGSPGIVYNPHDQNTYPFADPNLYDPYRSLTSNYTGSSAHNYVPPQAMPQTTDGNSHYTGRPEL